MINNLPSRLADGALVVVGSGLAARQLEPFLERTAKSDRSSAWVSAPISTYESWVASLWADGVDDSRQLLTPAQTRALWKRVVEESAEAGRLIGSDAASHWAADAWQRLWNWQVDPQELRASDGDLEFASFLRWTQRYRRTLEDNGWIDAALATAAFSSSNRLAEAPASDVIWADIAEPTPAQQSLYRRLDRAGWKMTAWRPRAAARAASRVRMPDRSSELAAAAQWAAEKLARAPDQRLALVIPDFDSRRSEVRRVLDDTLDPGSVLLGRARPPACYHPRGESCDREPPLGAAMTSLELLSSRGTFHTLSRWLRSPYLSAGSDDEGDRGILEMRLRPKLSSQLRFLEAYSTGGLERRLRDTNPGLAERLSRALKILETAPRYATPTKWARVWQEILTVLGWPAGIPDPGVTVLPAWEGALNELCLLTPIVGAVPMTEALAELERILAQPRSVGPVRLSGLAILERPEDLGPGYDAAWLIGLTDTQWPRPARPNPLLPLRLQLEHRMPGASPRDALERCERATKRALERSTELVLSWPGTVHEYPAEPSPLLATLPDVEYENLISHPTPRLAVRLRGSRNKELRKDPAPAFAAKDIPGGANTLSVQAKCPLRAFLESRLGARPLEPLTRGLNARQRGIITHRTLGLFLQHLPSRTDLEEWDAANRAEWAETCVARALSETFGRVQGPLQVLHDLERERLLSLTASLVANDIERLDFQVESVEERRVADVSGFRLTCQLDRVDALAAGGLAVIDYKTGRNARMADWFKDRLRDTQLPLYAQALETDVTATVIAAAHTDGITYRGVWSRQEEFPGRPAKLPEGRDWPDQLTVWRGQLELLVMEYTAGDTRILLTDVAESFGALAPLTRVYEQLALSRGWIGSWSGP